MFAVITISPWVFPRPKLVLGSLNDECSWTKYHIIVRTEIQSLIRLNKGFKTGQRIIFFTTGSLKEIIFSQKRWISSNLIYKIYIDILCESSHGLNILTNCKIGNSLKTHGWRTVCIICGCDVRKLGLHWFRQWFIVCLAPRQWLFGAKPELECMLI